MNEPATISSFFFFNDTATTEIYTLSLHDALPISGLLLGLPVTYVWRTVVDPFLRNGMPTGWDTGAYIAWANSFSLRSEEHTSELQSQSNLVCRLLLEKKKSVPLEATVPARELRWL